jgi:hypothetical protein
MIETKYCDGLEDYCQVMFIGGRVTVNQVCDAEIGKRNCVVPASKAMAIEEGKIFATGNSVVSLFLSEAW